MGRKRKFKMGQVVLHFGRPHAVVDWQEGLYRIVPLTPKLVPAGPAFWVDSWLLFGYPIEGQRSVQARRNYVANMKLTDRGCSCNCCPHVRIPASEVSLWETDSGTSQS